MLKDGITWSAIGLLLIPIISAAMQFVTMKISMKGQSNSSAAATNKSMMLMMPPVLFVDRFHAARRPGVYWISQSVFSAIQEFFMGKFYNKKLEEEEEARYQARQADRQKTDGRRPQAPGGDPPAGRPEAEPRRKSAKLPRRPRPRRPRRPPPAPPRRAVWETVPMQGPFLQGGPLW